MDEQFGKEHEKDVLLEFDRIKENFERSSFSVNESSKPAPAADEQGGDIPVSLEDIFGPGEYDSKSASGDGQPPVVADAAAAAATVGSDTIAVTDDVVRSRSEAAGDTPAEAGGEAVFTGRLGRLKSEKTEAEKQPASKKLSGAFKGVSSGLGGAFLAAKGKLSSKGQQTTDVTEGVEDMGATGGRQNPKSRTKKKKFRINWKQFAKFAACVIGICCLFVAVIILVTIKDAPEINPDNIYDILTENSVIYDMDGEVVDNVYAGDALRTNIEYNQLPKNLVNAFVCIEDKTFFKHNGFNIIRIFGAIWESVRTGDKISGTSTITQQLARNLFLAETKSSRSMVRKIKEAYYTVILESKLSKEQILEAYLNTIYLGFNSNGVQAASQAYFSKDVEDLSLVECAMLAALPQSPNKYAPIKRIATEKVEDFDALDIIQKSDSWTTYFNPDGQSRLNLVLRFMHDQEKLSDEEYEAALATPIRDSINPGTSILTAGSSSFFADYVVAQVMEDLQRELGIDEDEASDLVYNGGLRIDSTLSKTVQDAIESEYNNPANFPATAYMTKDKAGNIIDSEGKILLYAMGNMFAEDGSFVLKKDEYKWKSDGSLLVYAGKRLNIYKTSVQGNVDYSVEFKNLYEMKSGTLYSRSGGVWNIASQYKDRDSDGNLILSAAFFEDKPNVLSKNDDGSITLSSDYYTLKPEVMQPQSAMVIIDYKVGEIRGMIGGRGLEGRMLYNRALSPRQPGSSIKPLAVYSVALQAGVNGMGNFTAATPLDDAPMKYGGGAWPKNWYSGYTGVNTLRHAVEQSINACAVYLYNQLDPNMSVEFLQNMGVSSLVTSGDVNDINASAMALGGMTKGISPLEMAGAYGTFGNYGTYIEPQCYTKVTNKHGDVLLTGKSVTHQVMDESVASLMTNILQTTVTNGLGSGARIAAQPSAGKTGTTSERYDIWFCGLTPQYSAAVWIGNDVNIPMNQGSGAASSLWAKVMQKACANLPREEFVMKGDFVTATVDKYSGKPVSDLSAMDPRGTAISEIFIAGTVPGEEDDSHVIVSVCGDTGYLATPYCQSVVNKLAVRRPGGSSWEKILAEYKMPGLSVTSLPDAMYDAPDYYCPLHNPDPASYPISPIVQDSATYNPLVVNGDTVVSGGAVDDPDPNTDPETTDPQQEGDDNPGSEGDDDAGSDGDGDAEQTQNPETVDNPEHW